MPSTRSIASLTLSFGLVAIPVQVFSAALPSERISFNLLRAKDGSRVRQQYVAVKDGKPVERAEMAKGYEFAKDQFVTFTPAELKELEEKTSRSIDISEFVPLDSVDPIYFSATYFLAPEKGGVKPYALLTTALKTSRRCAVGRWISRGKETRRDDPAHGYGSCNAPAALPGRTAAHQGSAHRVRGSVRG